MTLPSTAPLPSLDNPDSQHKRPGLGVLTVILVNGLYISRQNRKLVAIQPMKVNLLHGHVLSFFQPQPLLLNSARSTRGAEKVTTTMDFVHLLPLRRQCDSKADDAGGDQRRGRPYRHHRDCAGVCFSLEWKQGIGSIVSRGTTRIGWAGEGVAMPPSTFASTVR